MPVLEDLPIEERVKRGNVLLKTRPRDLEETLLHLINDDDQVDRRGGDRRRPRRTRCGRSATTSSTCSRIATCTTGTSSKPRRGRSRSGGCRPSAAASSGSSRCRRRRSPGGCARCRSSPRSASTSCSGLRARRRQVRHQPGTVLLQEGSRSRDDSRAARRTGRRIGTGGAGRASDRRARGARIRAGAPGRRDAQDGPHRRQGGHARADGRRVAARCSPTTPTSCADCSRRWPNASTRSICRNLQSTGAAAELRAAARPTACCRSRRSSRLQRLAGVRADRARRNGGARRRSPTRVTMNAGSPLFAESAPVALWVILSGEVSLDGCRRRLRVVARAGDVIGSLSMLSGEPLGQTRAT